MQISVLCYAFPIDHNLIAVENLYDRLAPLIVTHNVNGSLPNCSLVAPDVDVTATGTVIGIVVPHLLPPAV